MSTVLDSRTARASKIRDRSRTRSGAITSIGRVTEPRAVVAGAEEGPVAGEIAVGIGITPWPAVTAAPAIAAAEVIAGRGCEVGSRVITPAVAVSPAVVPAVSARPARVAAAILRTGGFGDGTQQRRSERESARRMTSVSTSWLSSRFVCTRRDPDHPRPPPDEPPWPKTRNHGAHLASIPIGCYPGKRSSAAILPGTRKNRRKAPRSQALADTRSIRRSRRLGSDLPTRPTLVRARSPDPPVLCDRMSPGPRPSARHQETSGQPNGGVWRPSPNGRGRKRPDLAALPPSHSDPRSPAAYCGNPEKRLTFFQGGAIVTLLLNNLTPVPEDTSCFASPRTGIGRPAGLRFHSPAASRRVG